MLTKIISGGQTGADQAGLYAGVTLGLETGGTMPKGFKTERGPAPGIAKMFGLEEDDTFYYSVRTRLNIINSDGTVLFDVTKGKSEGSNQTRRYCQELNKPLLDVCSKVPNLAKDIFRGWLIYHNIQVLNVAGNRASTGKDVFELTYCFLVQSLWHKEDADV